MIINYLIQINTPNKAEASPVDYLRLSLPNNFSPQEIDEVTHFLNTSYDKKKNLKITPIIKPLPNKVSGAKKINLRHFYRHLSFVKIRNGVRDIDLDLDLGGMIGQILLFYMDEGDEIYFIQWTKDSFQKLTETYLSELKDKNLPWSGTFIDSKDLIPVDYSEPLDLIDHAVIKKYIKTLTGDELDFWNNNIISALTKNSISFSAWEQFFSYQTVISEIVYFLSEADNIEFKTSSKIKTTGYDSIYGVWIQLYQADQKEIIIPLTQVTRSSDPELHQNLIFYQHWVKIICPE